MCGRRRPSNWIRDPCSLPSTVSCRIGCYGAESWPSKHRSLFWSNKRGNNTAPIPGGIARSWFSGPGPWFGGSSSWWRWRIRAVRGSGWRMGRIGWNVEGQHSENSLEGNEYTWVEIEEEQKRYDTDKIRCGNACRWWARLRQRQRRLIGGKEAGCSLLRELDQTLTEGRMAVKCKKHWSLK